jgi:hypothetical protein
VPSATTIAPAVQLASAAVVGAVLLSSANVPEHPDLEAEVAVDPAVEPAETAPAAAADDTMTGAGQIGLVAESARSDTAVTAVALAVGSNSRQWQTQSKVGQPEQPAGSRHSRLAVAEAIAARSSSRRPDLVHLMYLMQLTHLTHLLSDEVECWSN